jgi:hypothetical protein
VGSVEELHQLSGVLVTDLHKVSLGKGACIPTAYTICVLTSRQYFILNERGFTSTWYHMCVWYNKVSHVCLAASSSQYALLTHT